MLVILLVLTKNPVHRSLQIFYYPWYGNPKIDGEYRHWDHYIIGVDSSYIGGDDIGANFYPQLGNYSSHDEKIIDIHMKQMKAAGVDVLSVSWLGIDSFEDDILMTLLDAAEIYGLSINIHVEPFYNTIEAVYKSLEYIESTYGAHPAIYKQNNKPLFYIYDAGAAHHALDQPSSHSVTRSVHAGSHPGQPAAYHQNVVILCHVGASQDTDRLFSLAVGQL